MYRTGHGPTGMSASTSLARVFKCCFFILQFAGLQECRISLSLRKRRQGNSEELLPQEVYMAAERLVDSGAFEYGVRYITAPHRLTPLQDADSPSCVFTLCTLDTSIITSLSQFVIVHTTGANGPGFCTRQRRPQEECSEENVDLRACRNDSFCTASCRCWNGMQEVETDIEQFNGTVISEQGIYILALQMRLILTCS